MILADNAPLNSLKKNISTKQKNNNQASSQMLREKLNEQHVGYSYSF